MQAKPYLVSALFCERVLQETDGVLSVVRIVDKATVEIPQDAPKEKKPVVQITALISFKSGDAKGKFSVQVVPRSPTGKSMSAPAPFPMLFEGQEHGNNLIINFTIPVEEEGLFWFDVLVDGEVMGRMPLRVEHKRPQNLSAANSGK
ncbi:MAG: DUF6941 family protein [Candidatus Acidiferrales bacterium]